MPKKKGKSISFDAMVKFFMQSYGIPTKRDIENLMARLDRLEELIKSRTASGRGRPGQRVRGAKAGTVDGGSGRTASDHVFEIIQSAGGGIGFADIQYRVGFNDKKLRNIIFRLNKTGKIRRIRRGIYTVGG